MKTILILLVLLLSVSGCRVAFTVRHDNLPYSLTVDLVDNQKD